MTQVCLTWVPSWRPQQVRVSLPLREPPAERKHKGVSPVGTTVNTSTPAGTVTEKDGVLYPRSGARQGQRHPALVTPGPHDPGGSSRWNGHEKDIVDVRGGGEEGKPSPCAGGTVLGVEPRCVGKMTTERVRERRQVTRKHQFYRGVLRQII